MSSANVKGSGNKINRISKQNNLCGLGADCTNDASDIVTQSGSDIVSSSKSGQTNNCSINATCSNSGSNKVNLCVRGAVCENSGTNLWKVRIACWLGQKGPSVPFFFMSHPRTT